MERNVGLITKLADRIEALPEERFDMDEWRCGTVGCIGGHLGMMLYGEDSPLADDETKLASDLGLTYAVFDSLCYPNNLPRSDGCLPDYSPVTRSVAVATLRHLAATGEVKFDIPAPTGA